MNFFAWFDQSLEVPHIDIELKKEFFRLITAIFNVLYALQYHTITENWETIHTITQPENTIPLPEEHHTTSRTIPYYQYSTLYYCLNNTILLPEQYYTTAWAILYYCLNNNIPLTEQYYTTAWTITYNYQKYDVK